VPPICGVRSFSRVTISKERRRSSRLCYLRGVFVAEWLDCNTRLQAYEFIDIENPSSDGLRVLQASSLGRHRASASRERTGSVPSAAPTSGGGRAHGGAPSRRSAS